MHHRAVSMFLGAGRPTFLGDDITGDKPMAPPSPGVDAVNACSPSGIASYAPTTGGGWTATCNDGKTVSKPPALSAIKPWKVFGPTVNPGEAAVKTETAASCTAKGMVFNVQTQLCEQKLTKFGDGDACYAQGLVPDPATGECRPPVTGGVTPVAPEPAAEEKSNTTLYAALGVVGVAALGTAAYFMLRKPTRQSNPVKRASIAQRHPEAAWAYSDAWSDELQREGVPGEGSRNLNYRGEWLSVAEWQKLMEAICPSYNGFDATKVGARLKKLGVVKVQVAREYSPAAYVRGPKRAMEALLKPRRLDGLATPAATMPFSRGGVEATEAHDEGDQVRLWWD